MDVGAGAWSVLMGAGQGGCRTRAKTGETGKRGENNFLKSLTQDQVLLFYLYQKRRVGSIYIQQIACGRKEAQRGCILEPC